MGKVKLEEVENSNRARRKAAIAALESKVTNLEEQLSAEAQERMLAAKANRKLENKLRRGMTGLPSSRLIKSRGSVVPGDDTIADTESVDGGGEESEKRLA